VAIDLRAAIEDRIGRDLAVYVGGLRAAGRSWREISQDIKQRTQIDVSHEALRGWFREELVGEQAS
jgi:hypothetical protein